MESPTRQEDRTLRDGFPKDGLPQDGPQDEKNRKTWENKEMMECKAEEGGQQRKGRHDCRLSGCRV